MTKTQLNEAAATYVRQVLQKTFKQKTSDKLIKQVAKKIADEVPAVVVSKRKQAA